MLFFTRLVLIQGFPLSTDKSPFNLKLKGLYLGQLKQLADASVEVIVPGTLNNYDQWIKNIGLNK